MCVIPILVLASFLSAAPLYAGEAPLPSCLMQPVARSILIPNSGFTWLPDGGFTGKCEDIPVDGWSRKKSGALNLSILTDGPKGSGRFWTVVVGVTAEQQSRPARGTCISTSTVGWRTLQHYSKGPLPWMDDVNNDGEVEFILWDSFPLHEEASMAEYALVAWVYRLAPPDELVIDWELSRELAQSLAKEYRSPLDSTAESLGELRAQAAEALVKFAEERCSVTHTRAL